MLDSNVLATFAQKDTSRQVEILKRTGLDTEAADKVLGYLAGNHVDRYRALMDAIARDMPVSIADVLPVRAA